MVRRYRLSELEQLRQGHIYFDHIQAELEGDIKGDVAYDA